MNRFVARICVAILISAAPVCNGQTATSLKTPKSESTEPAHPASHKPSSTNQVGSGTNKVARRLHSMIEKESESQFLQLVSGKQASVEDIRSITRLFREKQATLKKINDDLASNYSIDGDRNYRYDTSNRTIYELAAAPGTNSLGKAETSATDSSSTNDQGRVHMVLEDKAKAERFIQLTTAKQICSSMIKMLVMLDQEKEKELASQNNALLTRFKVSKDRSYEYDARNRALYELSTGPEDGKNTKR